MTVAPLQFTFYISHFTLISQLSFIKQTAVNALKWKLLIVNLLKIANCKLLIARGGAA